jgi:hypothetical protein
METLGLAVALLGMMIVVYLIVYTIPASVMRVVRRVRKNRVGTDSSEDSEARETYEIYISLHAA